MKKKLTITDAENCGNDLRKLIMKKEEKYTLTFKGLLSTTIDDEEILQNTLNSIELYLRRHHSTGGVPAIIFDENNFDFATLRKE